MVDRVFCFLGFLGTFGVFRPFLYRMRSPSKSLHSKSKKQSAKKSAMKAKQACKELRGKMMCGEKVNPEAVKQADKAYEEAILDLEIVAESIEELNKNLYVALEAHREEESRQIINDRRRWEGEREKLMREISKIKGRLVGLMTGIYHYPEEASSKDSDRGRLDPAVDIL